MKRKQNHKKEKEKKKWGKKKSILSFVAMRTLKTLSPHLEKGVPAASA